MRKIWFGLAFAAIVAQPAPAQDYHKNFRECAKEIGLRPDDAYTHKLSYEAGGRVLRRWYPHGEVQRIAFYDCLSRKANLAPKPSATGARRASQ